MITPIGTCATPTTWALSPSGDPLTASRANGRFCRDRNVRARASQPVVAFAVIRQWYFRVTAARKIAMFCRSRLMEPASWTRWDEEPSRTGIRK